MKVELSVNVFPSNVWIYFKNNEDKLKRDAVLIAEDAINEIDVYLTSTIDGDLDILIYAGDDDMKEIICKDEKSAQKELSNLYAMIECGVYNPLEESDPLDEYFNDDEEDDESVDDIDDSKYLEVEGIVYNAVEAMLNEIFPYASTYELDDMVNGMAFMILDELEQYMEDMEEAI